MNTQNFVPVDIEPGDGDPVYYRDITLQTNGSTFDLAWHNPAIEQARLIMQNENTLLIEYQVGQLTRQCKPIGCNFKDFLKLKNWQRKEVYINPGGGRTYIFMADTFEPDYKIDVKN